MDNNLNNSVEDKKKKSSQVPGQAFGYYLQETRVLARILDADSTSVVSLEVFDDVGQEDKENNKIVEQVKSTYDGNPVSDRSKDLWKTFSNWVNAVKNKELEVDRTSFCIYVSQQKKDKIVKSFSDAETDVEAKKVLLEAKNELWGQSPEFKEREKIADSIKSYVTNVFNEEEIVCKIIKNFSLLCGIGDSQLDIKTQMEKSLIPPELVEDTVVYATGLVKIEIEKLLEQQKPACIQVGDFRNKLLQFIRKHDRRTILTSFASKPSREQVETEIKLIRPYLKQLDIIKCDETFKIRAISDYLRASVDRTEWAFKGMVNSEDLEDYEEGLVRTWENKKIKTESAMANKSTEEDAGKYLYGDCMEHNAFLASQQVPSHFTPGSFHALADEMIIGWHPKYKEKLSQKEN